MDAINKYWPAGTRSPLNVWNTLSWDEIGAVFHLIEDFNIEMFIELGIYRGGLTSMLLARTFFDPNFWYLGVEKDVMIIDYRIIGLAENSPRVTIHIGDLFSETAKMLIANYVRHKKALLFCNAERVEDEMKEYWDILADGDICLARNREEFERFSLRHTDLDLEYLKNTRLVAFRK